MEPKQESMRMSKKAKLQELLYTSVKRGNWLGVVQKYGEESETQGMKLTQAGDTALHLAAYDNQEEVVAKLVKLICKFGNERVLEIKNERENTPLHVAAAMGSTRMCYAIASVNERLVDERNKDGETPLFLAALHGHKKAFYGLYDFCRLDQNRVRANCRRKNGDTILHCALKNEQFDLAFQVINMNKDAATWVDEHGFTPLHILASKPTAFKSGSHIATCQNIIYCCMCVDRLKYVAAPRRRQACKKMSESKKLAASFPDNYATCIAFFTNLWNGFLIVTTLKQVMKKKENLDPNNDDAKKDTDLENIHTDEANPNSDTQPFKPDRDQSESKLPNSIFPQNYNTCVHFFQIVFSAIMISLGFGSTEIRKLREKKQKHTWSIQVMEKLVELSSPNKYGEDGNTPLISKLQTEDESETLPYILEGDSIAFNKKETHDVTDPTKMPKSHLEGNTNRKKLCAPNESPMLLAAKNGVVEMVSRLADHFPSAIRDTNPEKKNVVLLAAEYRQPDVYMFLLSKRNHIESLFRAVDNKGNSALHLAAHVKAHRPWRITGAALQMQWEIKWFRFVRDSMPRQSFVQYNNEGKLAKNIFYETHKDLVKSGGEWLTSTSESCSLVAALIATVAFASATTVPGGNGDDGTPPLQKETPFFIFAVSSLIALCLSSTSVIMFLAILTSRFDVKDFGSNLPLKLLVGLSSLFFSIVAMLVSFCAGHYFLLSYRLGNMAIVVYIATSLPVALFFAIVQLPLYYDLLFAILSKVPKRSTEVVVSA